MSASRPRSAGTPRKSRNRPVCRRIWTGYLRVFPGVGRREHRIHGAEIASLRFVMCVSGAAGTRRVRAACMLRRRGGVPPWKWELDPDEGLGFGAFRRHGWGWGSGFGVARER